MTEDVSDVTSASPVVISDLKMSELALNNDSFRKPVTSKKHEKQHKRKSSSLIDKDAVHSELKKKKKKVNSTKQNPKKTKVETEDATESVDSGCIADIAGDLTDWPQVETAVLEERNYVLSLLSWLPDFQWVVPDLKKVKPAPSGKGSSSKDEDDDDDAEGASKKPISKKKAEMFGTREKLRVFLNEADEIDGLREKYNQMLKDLRKGRPDKKKEEKFQKKIKNLNKRNKKNANRQRKLEQASIFEEKHKALQAAKTKTKSKKGLNQKKIFNEQGKLVFSKFDFSSDGSGVKTTKAKNLELKVAQAIEEREMRRKLKEAGDLKGASHLKEIQAWSSVLKKAGGEKVRDDLSLLQKSLKRKENRKKQSKQQWEERTANLDKKLQDKQTKRQENIKTRIEAKREKRGKKLKQKGHIVPGF